MTITSTPCIKDGSLAVRGKVVLSQVPDNIMVKPVIDGSAFIGARDTGLMILYRFKVWWMIPCFGRKASDLARNTYGSASIMPRKWGSQCPDLPCCGGVFINSGDNPFKLVKNSLSILVNHKGIFSFIENKKTGLDGPTWDAFYTKADPVGIEDEGGCVPKFLVIDDGWQTAAIELRKNGEPPVKQPRFAAKLASFEENVKFTGLCAEISCADLDSARNAWCWLWGTGSLLLWCYLEALQDSVLKNLKDNNLINSMCMGTENIFRRCILPPWLLLVSLWGKFVVPDWDMFYSDHYTAEFHGAARAIVMSHSHNFNVIKKLVLPDGSILRAKLAGRPTLDCLFNDQVTDGKRDHWMLLIAKEEEIADENWRGDCAVYAFNSGSLSTIPQKANLQVSSDHLTCELFTVSPIRVFDEDIQFAPIGLVDMYNSGGAVEAMSYSNSNVKIKVRGCGRFGAYSNIKPRSCKVEKKEEEFLYKFQRWIIDIQATRANVSGEKLKLHTEIATFPAGVCIRISEAT
ncbi:hypothetical protein Patl1_18187 [Pistacia atlantica]|uniref:Uncharacterized protein n=1 Tax=Pistacia atlantica TaxID=434234 RepID=A0ACC1C200_9ROSI|nr:hypothetical protein Patl1_18187 [Pistacia atlantica]